jgi:hypothetical protein
MCGLEWPGMTRPGTKKAQGHGLKEYFFFFVRRRIAGCLLLSFFF